jgi:hypothetical protein
MFGMSNFGISNLGISNLPNVGNTVGSVKGTAGLAALVLADIVASDMGSILLGLVHSKRDKTLLKSVSAMSTN